MANTQMGTLTVTDTTAALAA